MPPPAERRRAAEAYDFRPAHPHLRVGTASDRYAGWIGQIYPEGTSVSTRKRTLGGKPFEEGKVPVESVRDYFEHFSVLEIDFTFYRPLLEDDGEPASSSFFPLQKYAEHAPSDAVFLLKAPQQFFARTLRRGSGFEANADFLDAEGYVRRFHEPAQKLLGERLGGVLFQQEYQRVGSSPGSEENVEALDEFFRQLPEGGPQAHLELRSEHLLTEGYFDWLARRGLGFVFSHWTWLPPIREQWRRCGERFTAADGQAIARLLTPRNMKYADAYAEAHPFDKPVPALSETPEARDMVLDATALVFQAEAQNAMLNLICNNRAWGNAPDLARAAVGRVLDEEEKRARA